VQSDQEPYPETTGKDAREQWGPYGNFRRDSQLLAIEQVIECKTEPGAFVMA
jgi:hypothetical protein